MIIITNGVMYCGHRSEYRADAVLHTTITLRKMRHQYTYIGTVFDAHGV